MALLRFNFTPDEEKAISSNEYSFVPFAAALLSRSASPSFYLSLLHKFSEIDEVSEEDFSFLLHLFIHVYGWPVENN